MVHFTVLSVKKASGAMLFCYCPEQSPDSDTETVRLQCDLKYECSFLGRLSLCLCKNGTGRLLRQTHVLAEVMFSHRAHHV